MPKIAQISKDGNLISVKPLTEEVMAILESTLRYTQVRYLRGMEAKLAGKKMEFVPTDCFVYKPSAMRRERLVTNSGYYQRVVTALKKAGYSVHFKDLSPPVNPKLFAPMWERTSKVEWRHRQKETIQAILDNPCGRVKCPTGWGKSFIIAKTALLLPKAKIDVTTKSAKVISDIYEALASTLPDVGLVGAGKNKAGRRVQCYCADSLHRSDAKADIMFADEGHELAAPSHLAELARYRHTRMYMFSASQDQRLDKRDFELEGVFGPIIMDIPFQEALANDMVVNIEVRWRTVRMARNPCGQLEDAFKERAGIWRNDYRNSLIAKDALSYPDDQVLIVVDTIEHALQLRKFLPSFEVAYAQNGMSPSDKAMYVRQGLMTADEEIMTAQRRRDLEKQFEAGKLRKAIATSIWNRGVNFHQLQVLIRGDAGGSPIGDTQIPGRVCRLHSTKKVGIVHDYRDSFDPGLERRSISRARSYQNNGWIQTNIDEETQPKAAAR